MIEYIKNNYRKIIIFLLIPVLIELFICNGKYFMSRLLNSNQEIDLLDKITNASGLTQVDDHTFFVEADSDVYYIEFNNLDVPAKSLYIDAQIVGQDGGKNKLPLTIFVSDEGYTEYYGILSYDSSTIVQSSPQSFWHDIELMGNIENLMIRISDSVEEADLVVFSKITLNTQRPMFFSCVRVLLMELIMGMIVLFAQHREIFKMKYSEGGKSVLIASLCIVFVQILMFSFLTVTSLSYTSRDDEYDNQTQYQRLAVSITEGRVWLKEAADYVKELDNPYDRIQRDNVYFATGIDYSWDNAYFDGKYYVYFGVVPVLLFYLPFYLITGNNLPNWMPIIISMSFSFLLIWLIFRDMARKWFRNIGTVLFLILQASLPFCFGFIDIARRPSFYEVPIVSGVMFVLGGLYFWLSSTDGEETIAIPKVMLGSLCMGLAVGCRPTTIFFSVLAFVIFGRFVIRDKKIVMGKYIKPIICFAVPYIVVALGLMWYNYIRFGSVFDFGFAYNMTVIDYTKRHFNMGRLGSGLFEMALKPFTMVETFPFLSIEPVEASFGGKVISNRSTGGGLVAMCPILMMGLLSIPMYKYRKKICVKSVATSDNRTSVAYVFGLISLMLGIFMAAIIADLSGIILRYRADFGFIFAIAAFCMVAFCEECIRQTEGLSALEMPFIRLVLIAGIVSVFIMLCSYFICYEYTTADYNPGLFYKLKYLVEIWR